MCDETLLSEQIDGTFFFRNPGIDGQPWPMFTREKREYVTLDTQNPEYKSNLRADDCQFWNNLIPQIRKMAGKPHVFITQSTYIICGGDACISIQ